VQRLGGEPPRDGRKVRTLVVDTYVGPAGPDLDGQGAHEELLRATWRSWVDAPNDLGITLREAVKAGGDARRELEAILDHKQWRDDRMQEQDEPSAMEVAWIRKELGVPA